MVANEDDRVTPAIQYPPDLPSVLFEGKTAQMVSPKISTSFASGRNRERRAFTAVPVAHKVRWIMDAKQMTQFERWWQNTLQDGTEWFSMRLELPQGRGPWAFRFVGVYNGPTKVAPALWEISATLEQWLRA